jgi:hypothetical protein
MVGFKVFPREIQQVRSGYYSFLVTSPRRTRVKIRYPLSMSNKSDAASASPLAGVQIRTGHSWRSLRDWVEGRCKHKVFSEETGLVCANWELS